MGTEVLCSGSLEWFQERFVAIVIAGPDPAIEEAHEACFPLGRQSRMDTSTTPSSTAACLKPSSLVIRSMAAFSAST